MHLFLWHMKRWPTPVNKISYTLVLLGIIYTRVNRSLPGQKNQRLERFDSSQDGQQSIGVHVLPIQRSQFELPPRGILHCLLKRGLFMPAMNLFLLAWTSANLFK